ncbi:hypothetical protein Tco_0173752, partial [Tanacetum coccineum]
EAIRLRGQLTTVEAATDAAKGNELKDLKEKNFTLERERDVMSEKMATLESANAAKEAELASLSSQFAKLTFDLSDFQILRAQFSSGFLRIRKGWASLESAFELFSARMEATQDEQARVLGNKVAELDAQLLEMAAHLNEETAIGCAVNKGIQDDLRAGVDHGKAGRDLSVIEAYDPSVEAKYVEVVNAFGTADFSMLYELKSKKDPSIVDLMDSLCLEGPLAEIPGAEDL